MPIDFIHMFSLLTLLFALSFCARPFSGHNTNVQYWGQNSAGAGGAGTQGPLRDYCTDDVDVLLLSFVHIFGANRDLQVNFANQGGGMNIII
jgi:hypothetical protein